jgi:murein DD-endopeptidase MepM/ murein hydrolase activator NlpD
VRASSASTSGVLRPAALAVAGGAERAAEGHARGFGALLAGGTVASAAAGTDARPAITRAAVQVAGPAVAIGRVELSLDTGRSATAGRAEALATATDVRLFDGRITVSALRVGVRADAGPKGSGGRVTEASADGLTVDGQAVAASPGRRIEVPGVGAVVLFERAVDADGTIKANGLRVDVTDPSSGLHAGTQLVVGHVEADATAGAAPARPRAAAPKPDQVPASPPAGAPDQPATPPSGPPPGADGETGDGGGLAPVPPSFTLPRRPAPATPALPTTAAGYVFPVFGHAAYTNDFGAPRAVTGWHHGNDIFAAEGTPLVAVADGTLSKVGVNPLGGNRLWLTDDAGNSFYYAHLSAYAPAAVDGARVSAGQVIGFLGNTGQAITTPPHLHFEVHPAGGPSVNPFPYLEAWERRDDLPLLPFGAAAHGGETVPPAGALLISVAPALDVPPGGDPGVAEAVR